MQSIKVYRMRHGSRSPVFEGKLATTMFDRLKGLLGSATLKEREAMVIVPCSSVHTFGMKYTIDVAFLDKDGRVIKCVERIRPGRFAASWRSRAALETAAGGLRHADIQTGDCIYWSGSEKERVKR